MCNSLAGHNAVNGSCGSSIDSYHTTLFQNYKVMLLGGGVVLARPQETERSYCWHRAVRRHIPERTLINYYIQFLASTVLWGARWATFEAGGLRNGTWAPHGLHVPASSIHLLPVRPLPSHFMPTWQFSESGMHAQHLKQQRASLGEATA